MDVQHEDKNMQRYLSKEGLANHLDVSVGLINKKLKELPHVKWGDHKNARVLFPVLEIEKYFETISSKKREPSKDHATRRKVVDHARKKTI